MSLAEHTTGVESSAAPSPTTTSSSSSYVLPTGNNHSNTPAIVGGVVGGIAGLLVLGMLVIAIFRFRTKRRKRTLKDNSSIEKSQKMALSPLAPGQPGKIYVSRY